MPPIASQEEGRSPCIEARALSLRYGNVQVLRSVDLSVGSGRLIGVLGPSGAGKSSLFRILAGEISGGEGRVYLGGRDVTSDSLWRRARLGLSYLPQEASVLFDCTVQANFETFSVLARNLGRAQDCDWLAEFELRERLSTRVAELSGGERRRLELVRTFMVRSPLYILDEPFTGIDPARVERIARRIRREVDRGASVLIADHRVGEVLSLCDEAWLLIDGEVRLQTTPDKFAADPAVRSRYLQ